MPLVAPPVQAEVGYKTYSRVLYGYSLCCLHIVLWMLRNTGQAYLRMFRSASLVVLT